VKLLVVDDSRAMRTYVCGSLKAALECDVDEASSGFEALRLLPRSRYDMMITDINMPDINGLELVRFVRGAEHNRAIPIIIISTQSSDKDKERALDLGATGFVSKPFKPRDIVEIVLSYLIIEESGE